MRARIASTTVVLLATAVPAASPAAAAPPSGPDEPGRLLQLSESATGPWGENLPGPLFDGAEGPIAPGQFEETFYVFNTPGTKANLSLTCTVSALPSDGVTPVPPVGEYDDLANALDLAYRVNSDGRFTSCEGAATSFTVSKREAHEVDVQLSFDADGQAAMDQSATYSITVTLSQIPPKGGGKPQVLGTQTLVAAPEVSESTTTSGTTGEGSSTSTGPKAAPVGAAGGKATPTKTTKVAATLPRADGAVTESLPLIGGLLAIGALLAGFRRRRPRTE